MEKDAGYSEKLLVIELIGGNEKAFRRLYDIYRNQIYAYSLSILKCKEDSEEIIQNVFLKVWERQEKLDASLSFKSYLYTITRNMCFNRLKRRAKEIELRELMFYRSQKSNDPADRIIREEEIENIKMQVVNLLSPGRKRIFEMSRNEGKSYLEISQELEISINTVKSQMSKGLETIRTSLFKNPDIN